MPATPATLDFSNDEELEDIDYLGTKAPAKIGSKGGVIGRPITSKEAKQIRQRARRKMQKLSAEEQQALWGRDISDWDLEELARGRPKAKDGTFKGRPPKFLDRQLHEEIMKRFETIVKQEMNTHTVSALEVIGRILDNDETDEKGRPVVPAGTKLDAAKFLVEHAIGKPKQRTETDISLKLQGILGAVMVQPNSDLGGQMELSQGFIDVPSWEADDDDDSDNPGE